MERGRIVRVALLAAAAYLVGSIQVPRVVQRLRGVEEPTAHFTVEWGEGHVMRFDSAGATTVEVTAGPALGVLTSLLDMSKSVVPALLLRRACPGRGLDAVWSTAAVVGQMLPPQHRFRGGRGSAMMIATCFWRDPLSIPVGILTSQLVGIYVFRNPLLGAHGWTFVLPFYFAARRKPEMVAYMLVANGVRLSSSISEIRQISHYRRAGEFETRAFHEAFESNHIGYIHKWLRQRGLIHYAYMDEEEGRAHVSATDAGDVPGAAPRIGTGANGTAGGS